MKIAFFNYLPLSYGGGLASFYREVTSGLMARYPTVKCDIVSLDYSHAKMMHALYSLFYLRNEFISPYESTATHSMARNLHQLGSRLSDYDIVYTKNDILDLTLLSIARMGRRFPPTIIGFHTPIKYVIAQQHSAKLHNVLYSSFLYKTLLKSASGFHVLNTFHERTLSQMFPQTLTKRVYNPIDMSLFKPRPSKQKTHTKLLWIGRLTHEKGCQDLISLITNVDSNVTWTIIGDGALKHQIENLQKTRNNVSYFPSMKYHLLAKEYSRHDLFICTSHWECLPYTVLEAQLSGLPVVGYNIPGVNDIVTTKTGVLCDTLNGMKEIISTFCGARFNSVAISQETARRFDPEKSYRELYRFFTTVYEKSLR